MVFNRYPELREVVVNCKTDTVFKGVLYKHTRNYIVLKNAQLLRTKSAPVEVDGEVMIDAQNIDFIQVVR